MALTTTNSSKNIGTPIKAFYQEVVVGDLKKYDNKSNTSKTGGGARDLRISPVGVFWDGLTSFFPKIKTERERIGVLYTKTGSQFESAEVILMQPTGSRKNECRICKIRTIKGWSITKEEYESKIKGGHKWFFLLILDDQNQVWASKFCSDVLLKMHPKVQKPLIAQIKKYNGKRKTLRNIVSLNDEEQ
jgi:hypothetical protein